MVRRGWGEGSLCRRVVRRGDKEYVYWRAVGPPIKGFGVRKRPEYQSRSEKAARSWLKQQVARADRGLAPAGTGVTVGVYSADWLRTAGNTLRPSTADFYRHQLAHFEEIEDVPITALSPAHVRELIAKRTQEGYASRTIRGVVQTLALVLRQAMEDGIVERNVAQLVKKPQLVQKAPQHFTAEQARRFLEVAKDDELGSLYAVALGTGLRRGELLQLTWRDVERDSEHGGIVRLVVRRGKTAAAVRRIPCPDFASAALAAVAPAPGPIWTASPSYVSRHFQDLCRAAGVPVLTFHSLRHSAASLMLDAGVDPFLIRQILGHTRLEMTQRYARSGEALQREAIERLGRMVG